MKCPVPRPFRAALTLGLIFAVLLEISLIARLLSVGWSARALILSGAIAMLGMGAVQITDRLLETSRRPVAEGNRS